MSIRLRKFIGAVLLIALVIVWALVAMALAQAPLIRDNPIASVAYYVIAGLGWVLPAMPIVSWMSRRNQGSGNRDQETTKNPDS
jgi:O-antigen/teichoic acid export membrane protein